MIERIAVVAPMLDEAAHVEDLVGDLAEQDFVGDLAIFVADGGSTDRSPELLADAAGRRGLNLTLLENPRRSPAAGLNVCVRAALRQKLLPYVNGSLLPTGTAQPNRPQARGI